MITNGPTSCSRGRVLWWACIFFLLATQPAYANSSWHWLTRSPRQILPLAVVLTLMVETGAVVSFGKVITTRKAVTMVALANVLSFVTPYVLRARLFRATKGSFLDAWPAAFNAGPYYMVRLGYLFLTLAVEVPMVYCTLKQHTDRPKNLLNVALIANVVTTAIVAVMERVLCQGQW